ncbi:MAG: toll/interleukin-1 receptor domain-containing protein [Pseudonocardiaceae bacterium]
MLALVSFASWAAWATWRRKTRQRPGRAHIEQSSRLGYQGPGRTSSANSSNHLFSVSGAGIFISYRRDDEPHLAGRLNDRITSYFGRDRVFIDVDSIEPGMDFTEVIGSALAKCSVLLVLIGRGWIGTLDPGGQRRLDDPNDYVRFEVETALSRRIRVIPILVEGAIMPSAAELPPGIEGLARRNAMEISHSRFNSDVVRVVEVLHRTMT